MALRQMSRIVNPTMIANGATTMKRNVNRQTASVNSYILEFPPVQWLVFAGDTKRETQPPYFDKAQPAVFKSANVECVGH